MLDIDKCQSFSRRAGLREIFLLYYAQAYLIPTVVLFKLKPQLFINFLLTFKIVYL